MEKKICPIMSRAVYAVPAGERNEGFGVFDCQEDKCRLWISVTSTERLSFFCCAFEMMALKNSEGQYRV